MAATWRSPVGCTRAGEDTRLFRAWCKKRKVLWDSCDIQETATTGRAVVAAEDIAQGAVVVEVPDDAVLMGENCSIADALAGYGLLKPAEDAILEVQGLILAVMFEKALGTKSKWGAYLSFLPQEMTHMPLYWEESELAELRGTAAADKMEGRVQHPGDAPTRVRELFEEVVLPFCQEYPDITHTLMAAAAAAGAAGGGEAQEQTKGDKKRGRNTPGSAPAAAAAADSRDPKDNKKTAKGSRASRSAPAAADGPPAKKQKKGRQQQQTAEEGGEQAGAEEMTEEAVRSALWPMYLWATAAVASYSFKLGDDMFEAMVPVWDALNHVTDKVNVRLHHHAAKGVLQMIATGAIPCGAEVVNCYGQLSSAELLRGYGFVEQANSKEHAQVPAHFLIKAAAAAARCSAGEAGPSSGGAAAEEEEEEEDRERLQLWSDSDSDSDSDDFELPDLDFEDDPPNMLPPPAATAAAEAAAVGDGTHGAASSKPVHGCPSLQEALQQLRPCWEEAWLLAHHLQLLPANGVFTVDAAGGAAPQLVALLQLLLLNKAELQQLYAAVKQQLLVAATSGTAGAAAAPTAAAAGGGSGRDGQQDRRRGRATHPAGQAALPPAQQAAPSAPQELLPSDAPQQLQAALQHLCRLMVARYTCSLGEDERLLQQLEQLPPRKAAAVVARAAEKRCWAALEAAVANPTALEGLCSLGAGALQQGVAALAAKRAATAKKRQQRRRKRSKGEADLAGVERAGLGSDEDEDSSGSEGSASGDGTEEESGAEDSSRSSSGSGGRNKHAGGRGKACRGANKQPGDMPPQRQARGRQLPTTWCTSAAGSGRQGKDGSIARNAGRPSQGCVVEPFQFRFDV